MYYVNFYTYQGNRIPLLETDDLQEVKDLVKKMNKLARKRNQPVTKIGKNEWEHEEEPDNGFIGSRHGILAVTKKSSKY